MKKGLLTLLCIAGMLLCGTGLASAVELQWTLLMDSTIAGAEPVQVGPRYLVLPGTSASDNCNFAPETGCDVSATVPDEGSYSFSAIEYDDTLTHSCLDLAGGPYSGVACVFRAGGSALYG